MRLSCGPVSEVFSFHSATSWHALPTLARFERINRLESQFFSLKAKNPTSFVDMIYSERVPILKLYPSVTSQVTQFTWMAWLKRFEHIFYKKGVKDRTLITQAEASSALWNYLTKSNHPTTRWSTHTPLRTVTELVQKDTELSRMWSQSSQEIYIGKDKLWKT
jgi:hypothetical protein